MKCYTCPCRITFPMKWGQSSGIPDDHPINGSVVYWELNYYDSAEAFYRFEKGKSFKPKCNSFWFELWSIIRSYDECLGRVSFVDGFINHKMIMYESIRMARFTVDRWFRDKKKYDVEELVAYILEHCFTNVKRDLRVLETKPIRYLKS